jgi:hypothetical protein
MKFTIPVFCSGCGCNFESAGYGDEKFPPAQCPSCCQQIHLIDPLTISVVADRLLLRSRREIDEGDFTLSIVCSAMAVECALTQVFLKWKGLDFWRSGGRQPTDAEQDAYEQEYKQKTSPGGFGKSADFVASFLVAKTYDEFVHDFVSKSGVAAMIKASFPPYESHTKARHIHKELFAKRNRIMHWGQVDFATVDASSGLAAATAAISVLKAMDREKYLAMEKEWAASQSAQLP